MGASQNCLNVGAGREEERGQAHQQHAPSPDVYPEVGDFPSSLPCGINHIRQELASRKLQPPEDYRPGPFRKDSFFELVRGSAYYRGEWSRGEPEGEGEVVFRDCSYFRGYFKDMQARGPECLFVLADGAYYLGAVAHSKRDGRGLFVDHAYSYDGEWLNNLPHGHGRETFPNGDSFEGRFRQGERVGNGLYSWAAGPYLRFEGIFEGSVPSQKGVLVTREGVQVQGQFDCTDHFDIAACSMKAKQFQITNGLVSDGTIQSFVFKGNTFASTAPSGNFKRKRLIHRGEASEARVNAIIEAIERGYRQARKHSEALEEIRKALPELRCEWWAQGEALSGLLIAEICGRKIRVSQK